MKHDKNNSKTRTYVWCDFETTGVFNIHSDEEVYPIEVGIILTDNDYNIYDTYQSYIFWDALGNKIKDVNKNENGKMIWPVVYEKAYEIHGIEPETIINGRFVDAVASDIYNLVRKYSFKENETKPVIISDNIQFEFRLMEYVMKNFCRKYSFGWPFHYCGYDTSEFLIRSGVGDPKNIEHGALRDAAVLLKQMTIARDRVGGF